jgi:Fic family protein
VCPFAATRQRARGFLDAAKLSEDWIAGMQKRALVLEAHYTTHIEGTQLTLEQSERILAGQKVRGARPDDAQELLNYKKAFELVSGYLESGEPITEALMRQIHKRLVQGVRGNKASPGEYRKIQNYIVTTQRCKTQLYCHPGGAPFALCHTDQAAQQRYGGGFGGIA